MNKQNDRYIDSLYLHFPFCAHLCNYCDFFKRVSSDKAYDYELFHQYLENSFQVHQSLMNEHGYSWKLLKTFYIGGGTPSLWGKEGKIFLEIFFNTHHLELASDCEFTLEVNPGAWTDDVLLAWRELGANRFSLGVQSLNKVMIRFLDRIHSIEQVYETLEYFKKEKLNFSMDFMLGLPFSEENKRDVIAELTEALKYNPSHFSVYILTVKDNYPYYKNLPSEEWIAEEFLNVANFLKSHGFIHYEVSNFAKPEKESRHNLNYWKSSTVAAFGPSATGFFSSEKLRYKWKVGSPEADLEKLNEEEFNLEKLYMGLRSSEGIVLSDYIPKESKRQELLKYWDDLGYLAECGPVLKLSTKGFLFLDSIIQNIF
jgi:oxygen-independent coproporphyrinogen-3 oxidase